MYQKIEAIQKKIQIFVDRTSYVIEIIHWASKSLRAVSDILATFPKPPIHAKENTVSEPERNKQSDPKQQSGEPENIGREMEGENNAVSGPGLRTVSDDGTGGAGATEKSVHLV